MIAVILGLAGILLSWRVGSALLGEPISSSVESVNGRIEAMRLDISTKYPGRIKNISVREGDEVDAGEIIARLDDAEILMQISAGEATAARARSAVGRAEAELVVRQNAQRLAKMDLQQSESMRRKDMVSRAEIERRQLAETTEAAGVSGARYVLDEAKAAVAEAEANIARLKLLRSETEIQAPTSGRIEYVFVQKGAVLPAGGKIASLLELITLNMTIFLPAKIAGKLRVGDEARVKLDALPDVVVLAKVTYVAGLAQFTPKHVETTEEREKLVYKVKLAVSPSAPKSLSGVIKPGMTGIGFVRTNTKAPWPKALEMPNRSP
jgi:HlyD family secretion protein